MLSNKLSLYDYFAGERDFPGIRLFIKYRVFFHVFFS